MKSIFVFIVFFFLVSCNSSPQELSQKNIASKQEVKEDITKQESAQTGAISEEDFQENSQAIYEATMSEEEKQELLDEKQAWDGDYESEDGKTLTIYGPAEDGEVSFEIGYEKLECIGFAANAYLTNYSIANWYDDETKCHINLTHNQGKIELTAYDCEAYYDEEKKCGTFSAVYSIK